jgi:cobyrinic acid a,c-diamide synthase
VARLFVSATHKSSGKTTISLGLAAALRQQSLRVQTFKKGPDYIDPMWLKRASGRPCYNLDFNTQTASEILTTFTRNAQGADVAVIEGNKGLHDGVDVDGSDSSAALAKLIRAPIVLVVDAYGMARGIAPLVQGYAAFDREARIWGVILNKVGSERQTGKLRQALERYTDIPILGAIGRDPGVAVRERHLGLTTPAETAESDAIIAAARDAVAQCVDLPRVREIAASAPRLHEPIARLEKPRTPDMRIAVARDEAFGFYYEDDLEAFERSGARLVVFDALRDERLPDCDGLFIGGGFPETHAARLAANASLRENIRAAIANGLPTYAECGGLMYLCRSIVWRGESWPMVGAVPADARMDDRPQGRGLVVLQETGKAPWNVGGGVFPAHEFHYAALEGLAPRIDFAYCVRRGAGVDGRGDGIVLGSLVASFSHLRDTLAHPWVARFVDFARGHRRGASPLSANVAPRATTGSERMLSMRQGRR